MEEVILKSLTDFGFPTVVTVFLLTKGLSALNQLTTSVNDLTKTVEKLSGVNDRLDNIERKLSTM